MAACGYAGRLDAVLIAGNETVHALNQSRSLQTSPIAAGEGLPRMTQRHEQPVADGQLNVITIGLSTHSLPTLRSGRWRPWRDGRRADRLDLLPCAGLDLARAYRGRAVYGIAVGRADQAGAL